MRWLEIISKLCFFEYIKLYFSTSSPLIICASDCPFPIDHHLTTTGSPNQCKPRQTVAFLMFLCKIFTKGGIQRCSIFGCAPLAPLWALLMRSSGARGWLSVTAALSWCLTLTWYNYNYWSPEIEFVRPGQNEKIELKRCMLHKQQLLDVCPLPSQGKEEII